MSNSSAIKSLTYQGVTGPMGVTGPQGATGVVNPNISGPSGTLNIIAATVNNTPGTSTGVSSITSLLNVRTTNGSLTNAYTFTVATGMCLLDVSSSVVGSGYATGATFKRSGSIINKSGNPTMLSVSDNGTVAPAAWGMTMYATGTIAVVAVQGASGLNSLSWGIVAQRIEND